MGNDIIIIIIIIALDSTGIKVANNRGGEWRMHDKWCIRRGYLKKIHVAVVDIRKKKKDSFTRGYQ
jgi:hypothetical protein